MFRISVPLPLPHQPDALVPGLGPPSRNIFILLPPAPDLSTLANPDTAPHRGPRGCPSPRAPTSPGPRALHLYEGCPRDQGPD